MGKMLIAVLIFIIVGALAIIAANDYKLSEKESRSGFLADFGRWVYHLGNNMIEITGLVIDQTWMPDTSSSDEYKEKTIKNKQTRSLSDMIINEVN